MTMVQAVLPWPIALHHPKILPEGLYQIQDP